MKPLDFNSLPVELVSRFETANVGIKVNGQPKNVIDIVFLTLMKPGGDPHKPSPRFRMTADSARRLIQLLESRIALAEGRMPPSMTEGTRH